MRHYIKTASSFGNISLIHWFTDSLIHVSDPKYRAIQLIMLSLLIDEVIVTDGAASPGRVVASSAGGICVQTETFSLLITWLTAAVCVLDNRSVFWSEINYYEINILKHNSHRLMKYCSSRTSRVNNEGWHPGWSDLFIEQTTDSPKASNYRWQQNVLNNRRLMLLNVFPFIFRVQLQTIKYSEHHWWDIQYILNQPHLTMD